MSTIAQDDPEYEESGGRLRDRIRDNPRPAAVWFTGLLVLVALELGHMFGALDQITSIVGFVVGVIVGFPEFVGDNFATLFGPLGGAVGAAFAGIAVVFILVLPFGERVPDRLFDRGTLSLNRRETRWAKRGVLTAIVSAAIGLVVFSPVGGVVSAGIGGLTDTIDSLASSLPSLTARETIPNEGHRTAPDGNGWDGPFLGLSPAQAWGLRVTLVLVYAVALVTWVWRGYNVYREHYRQADWTPTDDTLRRFRSNYWGLFGLTIVFLFVVMALWAPSVSPVTFADNIGEPNTAEVEYFDNETGEVENTTHVFASFDSRSNGQNTVGLWQYDGYDRWMPLGTTDRGQNMLTHLAYGARTSLVIGLTSIILSALIAVALSMLAAYYKGVVDLVTVMASDTIQAIPLLLLVMLLSVIFQNADHPLAQPLDGGFLLALIFALALWPAMWRTIRGPSLQVAEEEWVDAAKSYGQQPLTIMRKHMIPYITGYLLIYASLLIGGIIITVSALTFLGLGINPPTPEWGRLIDSGQPFVSTSSWHVATVPGVSIVLVVLAFNALGDAIRDAIDPEADVSDSGASTGGGG